MSQTFQSNTTQQLQSSQVKLAAKTENKTEQRHMAKSEHLITNLSQNTPTVQHEKTGSTLAVPKTARSNSATMLKTRIVDKAQNSVPISSKVHPEEEASKLFLNPTSKHQRQQSESVSNEAVFKFTANTSPDNERGTDVLAIYMNEPQLVELSKRIEACLNSSKKTITKTTEFFSHKNSLHELGQFAVMKANEIPDQGISNAKTCVVDGFVKNVTQAVLDDGEKPKEVESKKHEASTDENHNKYMYSSRIIADQLDPRESNKQPPQPQEEVKDAPVYVELSHPGHTQIVQSNNMESQNHHISEKDHMAGKQVDSDFEEEREQPNNIVPERLSNTIPPHSQSSELSNAIQENRNNVKALEELQVTHKQITTKPLKKAAANIPTKGSPNKNALKRSLQSVDPKKSPVRNGKKLPNADKMSSIHPSSPKVENFSKDRAFPSRVMKNLAEYKTEIRNSPINRKSLSPRGSRSTSPHNMSRTRSIEKKDLERELEDSFDKIHTAKKRVALSNSENFVQKMDTDIDFRQKKDQELLAFIKQHQPKLLPQEVEELYARLIEDTKEREMRKRQQEAEKAATEMSQSIRQSRDLRASESLFERLDKDAKRRSAEKREKEMLKEQEEMRFKEELAKQKLSKESQASLVNRMMNDALRRKTSKEKLLQAKIEQEIKEAKENAKKVFKSPRANNISVVKNIHANSKPTNTGYNSPQSGRTLQKSPSMSKQQITSVYDTSNTQEALRSPTSISHRSEKNKKLASPVSHPGKSSQHERTLSMGNITKKLVHHNEYGLPRVDDLSSIAVTANATDQLSTFSMTMRLTNNLSTSPHANLAVSNNPTDHSLPDDETKPSRQKQKLVGNKVSKIKFGSEQASVSKKPGSTGQSRVSNSNNNVSKALNSQESKTNFMSDKEAINYVTGLLKNYKIRGLEILENNKL